MDFAPGDVVQLKSGGPIMTFADVSGTILCIWIEKNKPFPPIVLEKVETFGGF